MSDSIHHSGTPNTAGGDPVEAFAAAAGSDPVLALQRQIGLPGNYIAGLRQHVAPLAAAIQRQAVTAARPILVGLNGCQGSGKSTLALFLARMLQVGAQLRCAIVSIDDFYLEKDARRQLASDVHPLLMTRGVPGTHDLALANACLDTLLDPDRRKPAPVPAFDKARDDRAPRSSWPEAPPGIDVVLLEGWCVGCPPQDPGALRNPVNALEREDDPAGTWRAHVNNALAAGYRSLFSRLDLLLMLKAPGFDCVFEWRRQQEAQLAQSLRDQGAPAADTGALLSGASLQRFIRHYERLTRHQLSVLPAIADGIIELGEDHRMTGHSGRMLT